MVRHHGTHLIFTLIISLGTLVPNIALAQTKPVEQSKPTEPVRPNSIDSSVFSLAGGDRLVAEAMEAITKQNYDLAATKLQDARQIYNQLSNFYQDLNGSFTGLDNRIADGHRQKALQAAQLRDKSTYQLALVYRAKNQPELAIPLLVQLVRSQQPTRELGKQAYQQLFELGFVDEVFPRASTPPKAN
jgi:thioredoxin-like negative regulator of GroEL